MVEYAEKRGIAKYIPALPEIVDEILSHIKQQRPRDVRRFNRNVQKLINEHLKYAENIPKVLKEIQNNLN